MLTVLFWNIGKQDLRDQVCAAINHSAADVAVLIESEVETDDLLKAIKSKVSDSFESPQTSGDRFHFFMRRKSLNLFELFHEKRISIRLLQYGGTQFLLGCVHLADKRNFDEGTQQSFAQQIAMWIREQEKKLANDRTIIIGDFNMNPFEKGMHLPLCLNAVMTKSCALKDSRTVDHGDYPFFYNPMWSLFGDNSPGPAGTFYYPKSNQGMYGWNMLDQVLIRPSAIPSFHDVEIMTRAGTVSLEAGADRRPDDSSASDHFPIILRLK